MTAWTQEERDIVRRLRLEQQEAKQYKEISDILETLGYDRSAEAIRSMLKRERLEGGESPTVA